jgi:hypothetical protein
VDINDDDNNKKSSLQKPKQQQKNGNKQQRDADGLHYCKKCGKSPSHPTARCYKLRPYSMCIFRKEVNAIARRADKKDGLKIVELGLKREQGKKASQAN